MDYLAVDFGTANCLAAEQGFDRTVRFVALEGESRLLPTALFIPREKGASYQPTELDYEAAFREALRAESLSYQLRLQDMNTQHTAYLLKNGPTKPKPPNRLKYIREEDFFRDMQRYERALEVFKKGYSQFINGEGAAFRRKLMDGIQLPLSEEQIKLKSRQDVRRKFAWRKYQDGFDETFFSALQRSEHAQPLFGSDALKMHEKECLSGFLLKSPKAFLGAELKPEHSELFEIGISHILRHIKQQAEKRFSKEFLGVVIGRPINFHGSSFGSRNEAALEVMRNSARKAGFAETRFIYEPHAASLAIARTIAETRDPALMVDLGGGTTDCTYLEAGNDESLLIVASTGERIGGADVDEKLAWHLFSEPLGRGVSLQNSKAFPTSIIGDLLATRNIAKQSKFRRSEEEIIRLLAESDNDFRAFRLLETFRDQLQHRLISIAENVKISLGQEKFCKVNADFYETPIEFTYDGSMYVEHTATELTSIVNIASACVKATKFESRPVRVFLTGGMSLSKQILSALQLALPGGSTFSRIDAFHSVCAGLSIVARTLSDAPSVAQEPSRVRGIPIYK